MSLELHIAKEGLYVTHAKAHACTHTHRRRGNKKARQRDTETDTQREIYMHTQSLSYVFVALIKCHEPRELTKESI